MRISISTSTKERIETGCDSEDISVKYKCGSKGHYGCQHQVNTEEGGRIQFYCRKEDDCHLNAKEAI